MDRYWVGGAGTWDATTTTNWAATSGGAGGASAPTSADNVIFDSLSNATGYTVTVGTNAVCLDLTAAGPLTGTVTFSLSATAFLDCYGSFTLPATNFAFSGTNGAGIRFRATTTGKTVNMNGVNVNNIDITFDGVGGGWTLGDAITGNVNSTLTVTNGTFDTGNYNVSLGAVSSSNTNTRTITLGSSTLTLSTALAIIFTDSTNLTFNVGTSQINLTNENANFAGGGLTYYNVSFTNTALGNPSFTGNNTFNNLTFAARAGTNIGTVSLSANQTITGTLTVQSGNTDPPRRIRFVSNTLGTARTITAAAVTLGSGLDFRDITAAGVASPFDVSTLEGGDCGGNTNITFPAAKTVYRIGTGSFPATQWASSSGGSPAANQFPLAQDTMVFDANTTTGTHTINAAYQLGTLTMTNSTTVTLASGSTVPIFYGNITLSNAVTPSGTGQFVFSGRSTQTITSSGRTFTQPITVISLSTVQLADALVSNLDLTLTQGTLDLNNQTATCRAFISSNSNVREIDFGTNGVLDCQGAFTATTGTNLTTSGTGAIKMSSASAKTFAGGGRTYPALDQAGAGTLTITGANTFADITNSNATASQITFPASTTTSVNQLSLSGSAGNLVSMRSSTNGTQFTIQLV